MVKYAFKRLPASGEEIDPGDLEIIGISTSIDYTVTSADILDSIIASFTGGFFFLQYTSDAAYNGALIVESQLPDGSWDSSEYVGINRTGSQIAGGIWDGCMVGFYFSPAFKYPLVNRIRITAPCTAGTCEVKGIYLA
jgi:hypothetical protein